MARPRVGYIRLFAALVVLLVIPVGLFARAQRATADPATLPGFLASYGGDILWPIPFFFVARLLVPRANRWIVAVSVLALTLTIEFGQLWQPPWLQSLRAQPVIGFMLGSSFLLSDVACILIGTCLCLLIDTVSSCVSQRTA